MKPLAFAARTAAGIAILAASSIASAGPPKRGPSPEARGEPRGDAQGEARGKAQDDAQDDAQEEARKCPEVMRGVALVFRPIDGGIALEFTSPRQSQVPELRQQLREAALLLEKHSKRPAPVDPKDSDAIRIPPLDIEVDDVGAGARVLVRAQRASDVPELLELAHALELFWIHSDCNEDVGTRGRPPLPYQRA